MSKRFGDPTRPLKSGGFLGLLFLPLLLVGGLLSGPAKEKELARPALLAEWEAGEYGDPSPWANFFFTVVCVLAVLGLVLVLAARWVG